MLPHSTVPSTIGLIPVDLISKIQTFLTETTLESTSNKSKTISATYTTFDNKSATVDLNVCRPQLTPHSRRVTADKDMNNLEGLTLVWLDPNVNDLEANSDNRAVQLRRMVHCFETFSRIDECLRYIRSVKDDKIFLIMSVILARASINDLNKCSQVVSIYIRCSEKRHYEYWSKGHPKIRGLFTTEPELFTQITKDVAAFFRNDLFINLVESIDMKEKYTEYLTREHINFLWSQLLIEVLLRLPQAPHAKEDLVHECRRHYRGNDSQQEKISEFEKNYSSTTALVWYKRDSFIYRFISKALRTRNLFYIFKYRFFLIDVYQQVAGTHRTVLKSSREKRTTVYRGQLVPADEFVALKENVNGFMTTNSFLWASRSSNIALEYAGDGSRRPLYESVYFEIEIDLDILDAQSTYLNKINHFTADNELLLCMGTVFRIDMVEPMNDYVWHAKLVVINEDEAVKLNNLRNYLTKEFDYTSSYLALGKLLLEMGEYDKMKLYYELLSGELPLNHPDTASIDCNLGMAIILLHRDSKMALFHLIKSIKLQIENFPIKILLLIQTLNLMADIYVERRHFKPGLTLYHIIREVIDSIFVRDKNSPVFKRQSELYYNIGCIYSKLGRLSLALKYYKISLKVNRKILPSNHPTIALLLSNIGLIHAKKNDPETSAKFLEEVLTIQKESLPSDYHPDIAQAYYNLGLAEFFRQNLDKSLFHFDKALEIHLKCFPAVHPGTVSIYNGIGNSLFDKKNYLLALRMYENAFKFAQQCWPLFHPDMSIVYANISKVSRRLGNYERAVSYGQKALDIGLKCLSPTDSDLAEAYRIIGEVYGDTKNHAMAVSHLQKSISIYSKNPPLSREYVGTLHNELGIQHFYEKQYKDAVLCLHKTLKIYQGCKKDESAFISLYFDLGRSYFHNGEYQNALLYYDKSIQVEMEYAQKPNMQRLSQKYYAIGETHQKLNEYQMALRNYSKALELVVKDDTVYTNSNRSILIRKYRNSIQAVKALM